MSRITACVTDAEKLPPTIAIVFPCSVSSRGGCTIISTVEPVGTGETMSNAFFSGSRLPPPSTTLNVAT